MKCYCGTELKISINNTIKNYFCLNDYCNINHPIIMTNIENTFGFIGVFNKIINDVNVYFGFSFNTKYIFKYDIQVDKDTFIKIINLDSIEDAKNIYQKHSLFF